jgi:1-acyl-sn-glycerol-3-phosphate acyltransferase
MPPAPVRRPLTITAWLVMSVLCLALSPLLLALGAVASAVTRRPQPLLVARLAISYFARELGVLVACGALWLGSGFGARMASPRVQALHHRLLRWFVHGLAERATTLLGIEVAPQPEPDADAALRSERPVLFFSRHAGPGDTLLLVDQLLTRYDRRPSVVFKETLAIDPSVDLIGHRLPHAVLDTSNAEESEARIEEVTAGLGSRGVLVLFPEGANFTGERRRRALHKLRRKGRRREAEAARQMSHVLPPHPTGSLAALRADPSADVVFAAHTGLGLAAYPREIWRQLPLGATLKSRMWLVSPEERPNDSDEQARWLYDWWKRLDEWVDAQGEEPPAA